MIMYSDMLDFGCSGQRAIIR